MSLTLHFAGFCDDAGHFALDDRDAFRREVARHFAGQEVVVSVEKQKASQSERQRKYWWAVPVQLLADELGYTPNQMHYALLGECFGYKEGPTGQAVPNVASLTELNREQFTKLIDWVLVWAPSELNIVIPEPDPEWRRSREAVSA